MKGETGRGSSLTIVIPAYNEAAAIQAGKLEEVAAWSRSRIPAAELIVVDDGSTDATADLAEASGARVLRTPHRGKAWAVRAGIEAARGEAVLFMDMDQAVPVEEVPSLLGELEAGADIAIGSRGFRRPGAPILRSVMSLGHWALRRTLLGLDAVDTQCGFKGFRREAVMRILSRMKVYAGEASALKDPSVTSGFDVELLLIAEQMGMDVREVPISWHYRCTRRVSKWRDSWRGFRDLLAILTCHGRAESGSDGMGRRWKTLAMVPLAIVMMSWVLLCWRAGEHYRLGIAEMESGEPLGAVREFEAAVGYYAPFNPYSRAAAEQILVMVLRHEEQDSALAFEVRDRFRRSVRSLRWLRQPYADLLEMADGETGPHAAPDPRGLLFLLSVPCLILGWGAWWMPCGFARRWVFSLVGFSSWGALLYLC